MGEKIELFTSDSDAWDDTALVQAWDATMESFKKELFNAQPGEETAEQDKTKRKRRNRKKKSRAQNVGSMVDWTVGAECEARYSGDGLFYQAEIVALAETFATVWFIDYDEEADIMLSDLRPQNTPQKPESDTQSQSRKSNGYVPRPPAWSHTTIPTPALPQHYANPAMPQHYPPMPGQMAFPSMPPPPPPCPVHHLPRPAHTHGPMPQPPCPSHPFPDNSCTDEALASMLMSWYKTGYSTGYYQALREHGISASPQSEASDKVQR